MNIYLQNKQPEFVAVIDFFKKDISTLRTGRANPALLEGVFVEAYGVRNPINAVANIVVADSRSLTIAPWDKSVLKDLEKAIIEANLGVGVVNDGDKVRITIPMMTEENRKDLVKKVNEKQEKARVSIRQIREEVRHAIEEVEKNKDFSEDEKFRYMKELDEVVTKFNEGVKELRDKKEKEVMEI
ncbi:ribosome recycling factor [Candidatus Falkowbacteria bacterium CG10_big_fil_rev_8_21_14_0_10_39_9]|uniref:Ribosome-recycling factor n=1 Tax=Candidatus Falkowbacteria bacterium CG10_big_fil_rev_8_21_14_0_10_39_9 TaxID=1974566 RepID=A0A2M6WQM0_9BACT|nr:MAG: ribosome recycling factor [Candidatus Falkowbacteria bacterium CG10_big_fil_rev_8_21_14_0_10_39_9]